MTSFHLEIPDMREGYRAVLAEILYHGREVSPRGLKTVEVTGATVVLTNPYDALPVGVGRGVNLALAAVEAANLVGEWSTPGLLARISPHMTSFMDDGKFWGAYGARSGGQMQHVVSTLSADPTSRRAYVSYWDPALDHQAGKANYPCMTSMQFFVRGDELQAFTYMRANDAWHGFAYDVFVSTQLQITVANLLGLRAGAYTHHCSSLHLYEEHLDAAGRLAADLGKTPTAEAPPAEGFGRADMSYWQVRTRARRITEPELGVLEGQLTPSEEWYRSKITKYL